MSSYIYLIGQLDHKDIYKIGLTKKNIEKRQKELQTGSSEELYVRFYFKTKYPYKLEKLLHTRFASFKKINEWFTLSENEVEELIQSCEKYEKMFESLKDNPFFK